MGIAKRSLEPEQDSADELDGCGEPASRCEFCGERGLATGFRACRGCQGSFCKPACCAPCAACGKASLCEDCQTATCPDCRRSLCSDCRLLALECAGCGRRCLCGPLCGQAGCGGQCLDCGGLVCWDCAVRVYEGRETERRCLDCAVQRCRGGKAMQPSAEEVRVERRRRYEEEAKRKLSQKHCRPAFQDEEALFAKVSRTDLVQAPRAAKAPRLEARCGAPAPRTPPQRQGPAGEAFGATPPRVPRAAVGTAEADRGERKEA